MSEVSINNWAFSAEARQPLALLLFISFNKGSSHDTWRINKSFVNAVGWYWYCSRLMCLFLLMINGSVVSSSGAVPLALHNHLWIYPRVSVANISAIMDHHNSLRKIYLVNSGIQLKAGEVKGKKQRSIMQLVRSTVKWIENCLEQHKPQG